MTKELKCSFISSILLVLLFATPSALSSPETSPDDSKHPLKSVKPQALFEMSCLTCKLLKNGVIVSIKEIQKKEDGIIQELCSLIPDHFNIPLAQCESIVE